MEKIEEPMKDPKLEPNGEAAHAPDIPPEHKQRLNAAISSIGKADFTELKGFRFPPREIVKLSDLLLLILGEKDPD